MPSQNRTRNSFQLEPQMKLWDTANILSKQAHQLRRLQKSWKHSINKGKTTDTAARRAHLAKGWELQWVNHLLRWKTLTGQHPQAVSVSSSCFYPSSVMSYCCFFFSRGRAPGYLCFFQLLFDLWQNLGCPYPRSAKISSLKEKPYLPIIIFLMSYFW